MFLDMWKQIPTSFKVVWVCSALAGLTVTGLIIVVLIKLVMKL